MSRIWITSCVSWINDRPLALEFEKLSKPYIRKVEELMKSTSPSAAVEMIYVMFVFDPEVHHGEHGVEFDRFSKKKRAVEATVYIYRHVFAALDESARLQLLANRLMEALELIASRVGGAAGEEIESAIAEVEQLHQAEIPGYTPRSKERCVGSAAVANQATTEEGRDCDVQYQLVLQYHESLIDGPGKLESLEESLENALADDGNLDGHDVGGGRLNIFILCQNPEAAFKRLLPVLRRKRMISSVKAASAEQGADDYKVLWPTDCLEQFEL